MTSWDKGRYDPRMIKGMVDEQKYAQRSPIQVIKITPVVRKLLETIRERGIVTALQYVATSVLDVPEKEGHKDFPSRAHDGSVVSLALHEDRLPREFALPIGGGIPFLKHMVDCPLCQFLAMDDDDADEETTNREGAEILERIVAEYEWRKKIN